MTDITTITFEDSTSLNNIFSGINSLSYTKDGITYTTSGTLTSSSNVTYLYSSDDTTYPSSNGGSIILTLSKAITCSYIILRFRKQNNATVSAEINGETIEASVATNFGSSSVGGDFYNWLQIYTIPDELLNSLTVTVSNTANAYSYTHFLEIIGILDKRFLDYEGLNEYDSLIKAYLKQYLTDNPQKVEVDLEYITDEMVERLF